MDTLPEYIAKYHDERKAMIDKVTKMKEEYEKKLNQVDRAQDQPIPAETATDIHAPPLTDQPEKKN